MIMNRLFGFHLSRSLSLCLSLALFIRPVSFSFFVLLTPIPPKSRSTCTIFYLNIFSSSVDKLKNTVSAINLMETITLNWISPLSFWMRLSIWIYYIHIVLLLIVQRKRTKARIKTTRTEWSIVKQRTRFVPNRMECEIAEN